MKEKEKWISLLLILVLLAGGWAVFSLEENRYQFPGTPRPAQEESSDLWEQRIRIGPDFKLEEKAGVTGRTNYRNKTILTDESFSSNLPLVIIDTKGREPGRGVVWDNEKGYHVPTGEDPYAYGEISVIDNGTDLSRPGDPEKLHSFCKIKIRGNSSGNYDKKQYLLKLTDENGKAKKGNVLNMGADSEWILNVSFIDPSLLRNYLAYTAAGEIMPYTPDVQFCEVLWKEENGYRYEGVYLMMESVKAGKYRVDLPQYSENSSVTPALLRRDRYIVNRIMLDNYATERRLTGEFLGIEYPDREIITEKGVQNITEQVSRFERALYADTWEDFIQYRSFVDLDSFVDYFILNEFFLNYDAGYHSTYFYMDYSGKLSMGPVWDFDQAMDNDQTAAAVLETTAFHSAPWFDRILQDPVFTEAVIRRYGELRKSILSDQAIASFLRETVEYLGPAIERDWARWGYYYTYGSYPKPGPEEEREWNAELYRQETEQIQNVLARHGGWLDGNMDSLYQFKMISLERAQALAGQNTEDFRPALAVVFVGIFLISVRLVLRYESE